MKKRIFFSLAIFLLVFSAASMVKASNSVSGWLWGGHSGTDIIGNVIGSTNLGWISMNSANQSAPVNYGVTIEDTGNVTGYAWSENLGWIDFEPTGPYPAAPNNSVIRNGDNLEGWARILSISQAGANAGGWKGWIKMHSVASDPIAYGVTIGGDGAFCKVGDPTTFGVRSCTAWSDELGWIDFSRALIIPPVKILKVCAGSCNGGDLLAKEGSAGNTSMIEGTTKNLTACYNIASDCSDAAGDVTNDPTTTWTEIDNSGGAISLVYNNPYEDLSAVQEGSEDFDVDYTGDNSHHVDVTVTVSAIPSFCGDGIKDSDERCDDGSANGLCPAVCSVDCELNNCPSRWKEITP